jgi:flagellar basal body-associated protein FliL
MANETAAPPKSAIRGMLLWVVIALVVVAGGASLPWVLGNRRNDGHAAKKKSEVQKRQQVALSFGDVVVNLGEDRLNRFLRVKMMLAVDETDNKEITELLDRQKAFLKNWLLGYLADQSIQDITRKAGQNRIRREIRDQFNAMLFPDGDEKIMEVLFDEFMVQ